MSDVVVVLGDVPVMRVRADMKGQGPPVAFNLLESKLPSLRGRRFYGTFRFLGQDEEYYACVERIESDDPQKMGLDSGVIPSGTYLRRRILDWERVIREGRLPGLVDDLMKGSDIDPSRPTVEFYRSRVELHLFVPIRSTTAPVGS